MTVTSSISSDNKPLRRRRWLIAGIVLVALLLRLWAAWQLPVDFDEPTYLDAGYQYAQMLKSGDLRGIIDFNVNNEHPPLVKIFYGMTFLILGKGAAWDQALFLFRLDSVIFGTLAVLVFALFDPLAGGLLALQTLVVKYTGQAYLEALPLLMSLLALVLIRRSSRRWDKWFLFSAIALGITGAAKYSYFPILFIILFILIWEKHNKALDILLYCAVAAVIFFGFDPYLWHDPLSRLVQTLGFHTQYAQGAHVQQVGYPWYQPLMWVSHSWGFVWHPQVFFYMGFDGLIFLAALPGFWLAWKDQRWVTIWAGIGMLVLLLWPTKWPQYTLMVLPAFCLAASAALKVAYKKLMEQELYWEWFRNMFPRPSKKYTIIALSLIGLLVVAFLGFQVMVAVNRIGWSTITQTTSSLPSNSVNEIVALKDGRMLIATDGGAALWKATSGDVSYDDWTLFTVLNSPLPSPHVLSITQDPSGIFWFGTDQGLARLDQGSWTVYHAGDLGLHSEQINTIVSDAKSNLWIGTQDGAAEFDGSKWKPYTKETSGLVDNVVFTIAIQNLSGREQVWFGTLTGLSSLDPSTGQWLSYTHQNIDLGWGGVSDLMFDSTGRLWVCTEGGGITLWDGKQWSSLRVSNSKLPYSTVESVAELQPGVFWIAASLPNSAGGVVARYQDPSWRVFESGLTGYSGGETVTIAKDGAGRYWFGTRNNGVAIYNP